MRDLFVFNSVLLGKWSMVVEIFEGTTDFVEGHHFNVWCGTFWLGTTD